MPKLIGSLSSPRAIPGEPELLKEPNPTVLNPLRGVSDRIDGAKTRKSLHVFKVALERYCCDTLDANIVMFCMVRIPTPFEWELND